MEIKAGDKVLIKDHLLFDILGSTGVVLKSAPCNKVVVRWDNMDTTASIGQLISVNRLSQVNI